MFFLPSLAFTTMSHDIVVAPSKKNAETFQEWHNSSFSSFHSQQALNERWWLRWRCAHRNHSRNSTTPFKPFHLFLPPTHPPVRPRCPEHQTMRPWVLAMMCRLIVAMALRAEIWRNEPSRESTLFNLVCCFNCHRSNFGFPSPWHAKRIYLILQTLHRFEEPHSPQSQFSLVCNLEQYQHFHS